jgi:hypothetical protein
VVSVLTTILYLRDLVIPTARELDSLGIPNQPQM